MVKLTPAEKREICNEITENLPRLRSLLGVTQAELGNLCGFSRTRVSQIETGAVKMTWSQLTSILYVCSEDVRAMEYLYVNRLLGFRLLQFLQRKEENIPPEMNVCVRPEIQEPFQAYLLESCRGQKNV